MAYQSNNHRKIPRNSRKSEREFSDNMQKILDKRAQRGIEYSQRDELEKMEKAKQRVEAERTINNNINSYTDPLGAAMVRSSLNKGDSTYVDTLQNAPSKEIGMREISAKVAIKKQTLKYGLFIGGIIFFVAFIILLVVTVFKNSDTQIYSNENDGKVDTDQYLDYDPMNPNVFVKYPGIYEKVEAAATTVGNKYKVDIDKYLILATLIAPIENGNIMPVSNGECGETDCYYFEGELYTWKEFLELWGDQAEFLAKAQILTYINQSSKIKVKCGSEQTVEQYAKNDMTVNEFNFWKLFNPVNWFTGFRDATEAEVNAKCIMDVPPGESDIPTVYVISKDQGEYYNSINANHERTYVKDPNTGGVYFWNLVNNGGFIHVYMKDYLNINESATEDQNYEQNLSTILDLGNYIYSYYESIRKDCEGYFLIESTIEKIKVSDGAGGYYEVPLEEYVGGVVLGEIGNNYTVENMKAFSVLARSYGVAYVGVDGSGVILNSSDAQNYDPSYNGDEYPKIKEAIEATKGLVITQYGQTSVVRSSYDAFCPTTRELINGFYYLPDDQNNLPINPEAYYRKTGAEYRINPEYLKCPCFQNGHSRPANELVGGKHLRFTTSSTNPPTSPAGTPRQSTLPVCWTYEGYSRYNENTFMTEYGWSYRPTGGHGRGASQYGLYYYEAFDYDWEALIKLFYPNASLKRLSSTLEEGECENATIYQGGTSSTVDSCGVTFEVSDSNYTKKISGNPLNAPLTEALSNAGYDIDCLNQCISGRVLAAGMGTREGVSEAAVALLECTMEMTGGFTYPYDHRGGYPQRNPDINGKLGVNSMWGEYADWATGCNSSKCRLGLNCANFVRWSMCNGGMDLCSRGSTFATGMAGVNTNESDFFPGAIRIYINGRSFHSSPDVTIGDLSSGYQQQFSSVYNQSTKLDSVDIDKVLSLIQPGDVLYSDVNGGDNHVMVIVGVEDSAIWIAENGRKTRLITYDDLKSGSKNYVVLLLDAYYENSGNRNNLSW